MKKVSLFSTALAVIAGLSIAESNANAAQRSNNNTNDVNEVGSLVYSNAYGQDYVNDAHSISVFKDSNGRYGIGQGTADSTAFFKINNDGTVTIWQLKSDPNTPTYKQGYTKKTVSIASLQKSENQTSSQKATINNAISAIKNNPSVTPTQSSNSTAAAASSSTTQKPTSRQALLQDQQVIDDLGIQAYNKYYGDDYQSNHLNVFKDSNGRYGIGQGTTESTMYYKINNDGKTMTVWRLASKPGTLVAQQKYITSTISLSSLGFNPDSQNSSQTTTSSNASSTQGSSASQTSSSATNSSATTNKQTTQTSSANNSAITSPKQTPAETKRVAKKASKNITVPSSQGKQTLSYYKVAALVYAKAFGVDRLNEQGLQLTMNKNHSRFILGDGTPANTILFRVNQGKKTVTVWTPNNNDQSMTKTTYDISALINEFYATDAQQSLINQTAQSLKK